MQGRSPSRAVIEASAVRGGKDGESSVSALFGYVLVTPSDANTPRTLPCTRVSWDSWVRLGRPPEIRDTGPNHDQGGLRFVSDFGERGVGRAGSGLVL